MNKTDLQLNYAKLLSLTNACLKMKYIIKHPFISIQKTTFIGLLVICSNFGNAQQVANDVTAPLHALKPNYPTPYEPPTANSIIEVVDKVYNYLNKSTPTIWINKKTGEPITNLSLLDTNSIIKPGDYRLTSYEWGVTYAGMMHLAKATGNQQYNNYVTKRFHFIKEAVPFIKELSNKYPNWKNPLHQVIQPKALDDAGAVCAAMIKAERNQITSGLQSLIQNYITYISTKEYRLKDKTLARNRPQNNTIWLDDLYMSVPALAQMGKFSKNNAYFDDACNQVIQFANRMFHADKNLFQHGWVESMEPHPAFFWARANGWALLAMSELLDVLPENHPKRKTILTLFQNHVKGLATYQDGTGFWHQLLNKNDSYLETSATAIYTYCIANGIQKKWLDKKAYAPMVLLAWNAVASKVNAKGQIEGTCVGTGMGFDPAFYYYRPINVYAAHGYGPVLLAGAAVLELIKSNTFKLNDSALQAY